MFQRGFIEARRSVGRCRLSTPSIQVSSARRDTLCPGLHTHGRPFSSILNPAPTPPLPDGDSSSVTDAYTTFRSSVLVKHLDGIHASYPVLSVNSKELQTSETLRTDLLGALQVLAVSKRTVDLSLADRILADLPVYGIRVDSSVHDAVLQAILDNDDLRGAYNWLRQVQSKPGACVPTSKQWHALLKHSGTRRNVTLGRTIVGSMRRLDCPPTHDTFTVYFEALIESGYRIPIRVVQNFVDIMKKEALPYHGTLLRTLSDYYTNSGQPRLAQQTEEAFRLAYITSNTPSISTNPTKDAQLATVAKKKGHNAAVRLYKDFEGQGFKASESTLLAILNEAVDASVLTSLAQHLNVTPGPAAWTKMIHSAVNKGLPPTAFALYKLAVSSGVRPTNAMLHPVLRALCAANLSPPRDSNIDRAIDLYLEYIRLHDESQDSKPSTEDHRGNSTKPDAPIYNTLLRALTSSQNTSKYFPIALSALEDMQARRVLMDKMTTTSVIVMLMRCSSDFEDAFRIYKLVCRAKDRVLDQEGYVVVLNAFCKVSSAPPPARLYFEIVRDMRAAGYTTSAKVYTIILKQLYDRTDQLSSSDILPLRAQLVHTIERVHQSLLLDASLTPDTGLWNQLMNTYQRAGGLTDAFRIWEMLYRSRLYDNISVSIILDACSHADAWDAAERIYANLLASGFRLNLRNWNNWLECLCRFGRLDHAVKTACLEMGEYGVQPDEHSVEILLKFSARTNQETEVGGRIKQYLPKLWSRMRASGRI